MLPTSKTRTVRTIHVQPGDRRGINYARSVRNPDGTVPHIVCEGARFHVLSWSTKGMHCSEPRCVLNRIEGDDDG